jgi:hypothetical protein
MSVPDSQRPVPDRLLRAMSNSVTPVKDYQYKIVVLNRFNETMRDLALVGYAHYEADACASVFNSIIIIAGLILPYASRTTNEIVDQINKEIARLNIIVEDIDTFPEKEKKIFVKRCTWVLVKLMPLLSYIGISNKQITVGEFSFPGESKPQEAVANIIDAEQDTDLLDFNLKISDDDDDSDYDDPSLLREEDVI